MNSIKWPASNVWVFIAQSVEHCSANAEAMGSDPVEAAKTFFGLTLRLLKSQSQLQWSHLHFIRLSAVHIMIYDKTIQHKPAIRGRPFQAVPKKNRPYPKPCTHTDTHTGYAKKRGNYLPLWRCFVKTWRSPHLHGYPLSNTRFSHQKNNNFKITWNLQPSVQLNFFFWGSATTLYIKTLLDTVVRLLREFWLWNRGVYKTKI